VFIAAQRRDVPAADALLAALAQAHVTGVTVRWAALLPRAAHADLPTYAFQHDHYWPRPLSGAGDVASAGLDAVAHPLLAATVGLASGAGLVVTGRLSLRAQPWLADHVVAGVVIVPGTAFVELAVVAGHVAGTGRLAELALEAPLIVPAAGAVQVQVTVGGPDGDGTRAVEVHARLAGDAGPWTRHASGILAAARPGDVPAELTTWPPEGAEEADVSGLYDGLAGAGYGYGPAFQGLRAAWRRGDDVFAEVALPGDAAEGASAFGVHPALLDAALHASSLTWDAGPGAGQVLLPFAWRDVTVHAAGASVLRVRLGKDASGAMTIEAADGTGAPVISVRSLALRPVQAGQLASARAGLQDAMFTVDWTPVTATAEPDWGTWAVAGPGAPAVTAGLSQAAPVTGYPDLAALAAAVEAGGQAPEVVLAFAGTARTAASSGSADGASARLAAGRVLGLVQEWLALGRLSSSRLVIVTCGAVAAAPGEGVADLAGAACWGLVRSAQSEEPGRIVLADLPPAAAGDAGLAAEAIGALAPRLAPGEPELAVRDGRVVARRLARPGGALVPPGGGVPWRLESTGDGTLDGLVLRELP
jgi:acyl transferase domain-containing protein